MLKRNRAFRRGLYILIAGLMLIAALTGCKDKQAADGWPVTAAGVNSLPAWNAGQFGSVKLMVNGIKAPATWKVKNGSALPEGFKLAADGTFSGTPPLLPAGTTQRVTPPFTVIMIDADGKETEIQLSVTILQVVATSTPTVFTTPTTAVNTTSATTTTTPATPTASIDKVQFQYIGIEWTNGLGDYTYAYRVITWGTAAGPVDTALAVNISIKAANVSLFQDVRNLVTAEWSVKDAPYNCVRRTASDPAQINWRLVQDIVVSYGPTAGPEWPSATEVAVEAKIMTWNGGGYGVISRYTRPFAMPMPP